MENSKKRLRTKLAKQYLKSIKVLLDTEDREYVAFYFHKLGALAGVNVSYTVNRWLYGWPLAIFSLFKRGL